MNKIGIDLGTTNSLVSFLTEDGPVVIPNELEEYLTLSAVAIASDGQVLVGRAAHDRLVNDPTSGIAFFKRDMGTEKRYTFGGRQWSPVECSALILKEKKRIAELYFGHPVEEAVITVPAYFHDKQRKATKEAAEIAGLKVERILNEPTAAALAFGYRNPEKESQLMVFDIGGGTFDVTILEVFEGVIEIKASCGESRLGGEDYTDALLDHLVKKHELEADPEKRLHWRQQVEVAKRRFTKQKSTVLSLSDREISVSLEEFAEASKAITARLRPVVQRCMRDAGLKPNDLDDILLVGGASRMPMIHELIGRDYERIPNRKLDPDRVVAFGAAVQAALCGKDEAVQDIVLTDVCPHTLGIEVSKELVPGRQEDGFYQPIIDRNTTVPVSRSDMFHTTHPQQEYIELKVYQGEGRMTKDNTCIGSFKVKGLKAKPRQRYPGAVDVRFSYDMNGMLEVEVTVLETGKKVNKVFEQHPGSLTPAEIKKTLERLAPLKVHPKDLLPNRARMERADRLYTELMGPARDVLTNLVDAFARALEIQDEKEIQLAAYQLDEFMNPFFAEEGEAIKIDVEDDGEPD